MWHDWNIYLHILFSHPLYSLHTKRTHQNADATNFILLYKCSKARLAWMALTKENGYAIMESLPYEESHGNSHESSPTKAEN